ncbi:MAG TPA: GDSL-type esterase/lipase family protein [Bacillales bacterium]|nr:GDSL-type esterase/lipase family protein [Bacillales bacterium]
MPDYSLIYTAIGDSLSVGTGSLLAPGFEKRYAKLTEQALQHTVKVNIFAKNGATSGEILQRMYDNKVRTGIYHASIITITAGGNDLIHAAREYAKTQQPYLFEQAIHQFSINMSNIMQEIYAIKASSPFMIRLVGLYNPFPSLEGSDYYVQSFNHHLQSFSNANTKVADIFYPFKHYGKKVLFLDGLHPNGKGYQVIAEVLYQLGYYPLRYY